MRIYASTSYNDHYQYLNTFQQTMPNGLVSYYESLMTPRVHCYINVFIVGNGWSI